MSHIVKIETKIRDLAAVKQACLRLQLIAPIHGRFKLYSSEESGCGVELLDWKYPVVCQLETGELKYDNYGGRWGNPQRLDEFIQRYAVEKSKIEARKQGFTAVESRLQNGSIKVTSTPEVPHETDRDHHRPQRRKPYRNAWIRGRSLPLHYQTARKGARGEQVRDPET